MLKQKLDNLIAMSFFFVERKTQKNIDSFLTEKKTKRKTSKHWVDEELNKKQHRKNTGSGKFL